MKTIARPRTLAEVSTASTSRESFGLGLADFEHELVKLKTRKALLAAIGQEPQLLGGKFDGAEIADAWLAAYAEYICFQHQITTPDWIWNEKRFLQTPYIHDSNSPKLKVWHTLKSPTAFSRRNLFVDFQMPKVSLMRGRPQVPRKQKPNKNRKTHPLVTACPKGK